jgi:hypothetical protein
MYSRREAVNLWLMINVGLEKQDRHSIGKPSDEKQRA